ncbi:unnamed protein product [Rotaria sordida]|uniref:protein-tyrosine-phosphatase n=1 Tax=Rotaria sordida TaxID=392033 RepID=A0A813TT74_9BILA|nr:unnamed protein product [Rotaria sordida]CAF0813642.1 unnamed protein product [Rotaria sordida]
MFSATKPSYGGASNFHQALAYEARLNRLHRLFKTHFNVTEPSLILEPYLFLGNCISAQDIHRLSRLGIRYILNVAKRDVELCPYYPNDVRTLTIDLRDDDRENILRAFDQAFAFIDEARRSKSRILVHCSHGQSRSPAIVIGYLMRTYNVSLEQCLTHVVKARPCVIPNDGFLKQLILFDRFLNDRRLKQQAAAAMQTTKRISPTEIPIQHHPSVASKSMKPPIPPKLTPAQHPTDPVSNTANASSVNSASVESSANSASVGPSVNSPNVVSSSKSTIDLASKSTMDLASKSTMGLASKSSIQSSASTNSIHVIPIQIASKESSPDKIELTQLIEVPTDDHTSRKDTHKNGNRLEAKNIKQPQAPSPNRLPTSSSHNVLVNKNRSSKKKINFIKPVPTQISRSKTDDFARSHGNHYHNHPSATLTPEQWNIINNMPPTYYNSNPYKKTNYITEIYDRATRRFIPTAYCC